MVGLDNTLNYLGSRMADRGRAALLEFDGALRLEVSFCREKSIWNSQGLSSMISFQRLVCRASSRAYRAQELDDTLEKMKVVVEDRHGAAMGCMCLQLGEPPGKISGYDWI